eukprot:175378-Chlamydomonas_euryale.AAC.1
MHPAFFTILVCKHPPQQHAPRRSAFSRSSTWTRTKAAGAATAVWTAQVWTPRPTAACWAAWLARRKVAAAETRAAVPPVARAGKQWRCCWTPRRHRTS